ncbi:hypothetical protein [Thermococcus sp.]
MKAGKERLRREAYRLGYTVGLYSHSEWMPWIEERRRALIMKARSAGAERIVKEEYERGKRDGAEKRESLIMKGLEPREEEIPAFRTAPVIKPAKPWRAPRIPAKVIYSPPVLIGCPRMSRRPRLLGIPRFLRP